MSDEAGTSTESAPAAPAAPAPTGGSGPADTQGAPTGNQSQGNPSWDTYRSKLGTESFKLIESDLANQDRLAQQRIEQANAKAKQYEDLGSLENIQQAMALAQQIGSDPKSVYDRLAGWLRQNGMLEEAQAVEDAADEAEGEEEESEDPRLTQLQQGQEEMRQFLAQQQFERVQAAAVQEFEGQVAKIQADNPWMTEDDTQEILSRALAATANGGDVDIPGAAAQYIGLRTRLLSTPRPGDRAPQLLPTGGSAPARQSDFDFSKASKEDRRSYVSDYLKAHQG